MAGRVKYQSAVCLTLTLCREAAGRSKRGQWWVGAKSGAVRPNQQVMGSIVED